MATAIATYGQLSSALLGGGADPMRLKSFALATVIAVPSAVSAAIVNPPAWGCYGDCRAKLTPKEDDEHTCSNGNCRNAKPAQVMAASTDAIGSKFKPIWKWMVNQARWHIPGQDAKSCDSGGCN
jgi:hypothetical protein